MFQNGVSRNDAERITVFFAAEGRVDFRTLVRELSAGSFVCDVSGSLDIVNVLVQRLAPGGEIVLAGFYDRPVSFDFAPAFMRELRLRVAAQWQPSDLSAVAAAVTSGRLSLDGIISHVASASSAPDAYAQAFEDVACLKMCLDWRTMQ